MPKYVLFVLLLLLCFSFSAHAQIQVGYGLITTDNGSRTPAATALFSYSNADGVLVSQAGVEASIPIRSGEFFVDESGTKTSIALVNTSAQSSTVNFVVRNQAAQEAARGSLILPAGQQTSRYIRDLFPNLPAGFSGSLRFDSDAPLFSVALRESHNAYGEPVYSTLPVINVAQNPSTDTIILPHLAAGGGFTTQLVLINPSSRTMRGKVRLSSSSGLPLQALVDGNLVSEFVYQIEPQGAYRAELNRAALAVGFASVIPDTGTETPSGTAIFRLKAGDQLVTEASVVATASTTRARIFIDNARSRTGVAIANYQSIASTVTFKLLNRDGTIEASTEQPLPAGGHFSIFADELFPSLTDGFTGVMEFTSAVPIAPVTLKLAVNSRGDLVLATLPVADLNKTVTAPVLGFPQIDFGGGFSTRLILINADPASLATGSLAFYQTDGSKMIVPVSGQTASSFPYQLTASGGRQFYPGNSAGVASIRVVDIESNRISTEVTLNEGGTLRVRLQIVDTTGVLRDDIEAQYLSANPDVATVSSAGNIQGKRAGFSTLTVSAGGVVATATVTVARIDSGALGFEPTGITQDLAKRLYLAATQEHAIFLTQDLKSKPAVYAGVQQSPGLKNDVRLQSLFKNPGSLTLDQSGGNLFVSDSANNIIRRIAPGPNGRVETVAGTGQPGSQDGQAAQASFNNPQGIALDPRGNIWVVDSGNHTIRKISLITGRVDTVAGKAGVSGFSDGQGDAALFNSPTGIAVVTEPLAQQLDRQRRGDPPPPVTLIVADTGNGAIRQITENRNVVTLQAGAPGNALVSSSKTVAGVTNRLTTLTGGFSSPTSVTVDPLGNIFVTESAAHRVRVRLQNGNVIGAAQAFTFSNPNGIVVTASGNLVVTDGSRTAVEIKYGEPQITNINPSKISIRGGERVTVSGANFAPDTVVILGGVIVPGVAVSNTQALSFTAPAALPSGVTTLTVQNRGGLAQTSMTVEPPSLASLPTGYITTVVGGSTFAGEGSLALASRLLSTFEVAVDQNGNLYIADTANHRIRKVSAATGVITTVAGTGQAGFSGDKGLATAAQLAFPWGIALNSSGDLYIADNQNHRIRKVSAATGIITTVAGTGEPGFSGEGALATTAMLSAPYGIAIDRSDNLIIADSGNYRIRRLDPATGIIKTIAGTGNSRFFGDNGPATAADFKFPFKLTIDSAGSIFVSDPIDQRIRKINSTTGLITTVAGSGEADFSGDGGAATAAAIHNPIGIAVDAAGNLFIADSENNRIRKVASGTNIISTIAGAKDGDFSGDGGPASQALLLSPYSMVLDGAGNLLIGDSGNYRIRKISATDQTIATVAGIGEKSNIGDNGPATAAVLGFPSAMVFDSAGNLLIADTTNHRVRKVNASTGLIATIAGNGQIKFAGDDGVATEAALSFPQGVAVNRNGDIFVSDSGNHRIRKIQANTGTITTIAGRIEGFFGDNGPAAAASLDNPKGIALDAAGNLYIADAQNNRVRRIDAATGVISTVAGNGQRAYSGDNGPAAAASLAFPVAVAIDGAGNLFIADYDNSRVRKIDARTGIITTLAGNGQFDFAGDGGPAISAALDHPGGFAFDSNGNLFISDQFNRRVRKIDARTGIITTIAGSGQPGITGDGGPASNAAFDRPYAVAIDSAGNIFIADAPKDRIRAVRGPVN